MDVQELRSLRKKTLAWAKKNLAGRIICEPYTGKELCFTVRGIKELVNQPHAHYREKMDTVLNILRVFPVSDYVGTSKDEEREDYVFRYYKTKIAGEDSYFVVRENLLTGLVDLYSIVDKIKE